MLWMITDFSKSKSLHEAREQIDKALKNGADRVSLRKIGDYTDTQILELALDLSGRHSQKKIFIHNPGEGALKNYNCFHFSQRFLKKAVELKKENKNKLIAISLHDAESIKKAFDDGMDYAFYSPVYSPISKPGDSRKTVDPIYMKNLYLLGGINRMRGRTLIENGFTNLAGISLFYGDTAQIDISELSELIKEKCK